MKTAQVISFPKELVDKNNQLPIIFVMLLLKAINIHSSISFLDQS